MFLKLNFPLIAIDNLPGEVQHLFTEIRERGQELQGNTKISYALDGLNSARQSGFIILTCCHDRIERENERTRYDIKEVDQDRI